MYVGRLKDKIRALESRVDGFGVAAAEQAKQFTAVAGERDTFRVKAEKLEGLADAHHQLAADHALTREQVDALEREAASLRNRVKKTLRLEGAIWTRPVMAGTCPFRPLADRRTPVVSVLNLKGGVGKTTLTAYLGWALAARGYRVLLVDLDLQGSLSSFFVDNTRLSKLEADGRTLRHYLDRVTADRTTKLLDFAVPVPQLNAPGPGGDRRRRPADPVRAGARPGVRRGGGGRPAGRAGPADGRRTGAGDGRVRVRAEVPHQEAGGGRAAEVAARAAGGVRPGRGVAVGDLGSTSGRRPVHEFAKATGSTVWRASLR